MSSEDILDFASHLLTNDKFRPVAPSLPNKLYHYCGAAGLMGMMTDKKVWATESNFLNDKTELFHGIDIIKEACEIKLNTPGVLSFIRNGLQSILKHPIVLTKSHSHIASHIFTTSFSEIEDDLNQWRCYSENGEGFCVGINPSEMIQSVFYKLEYDRVRQLSIIDTCLNAIFTALAARMPNLVKTIGSGQGFPSQVVDIIVGTLLINSLTLKHPVFKAEQEWRTILIVRKDQHGVMFPMFSTNFSGKIVPRAKLPFVDPSSSPSGIDIWAGPRRNFETTKIALDFEFLRLGYKAGNIRIHKSAVPYQ